MSGQRLPFRGRNLGRKIMVITLVVAAAKNNAIGKDNHLLWRLPNDMKYFKNVTWGMPVLMGRKTFESLGKPLPGRKNMVLTKQPGWKAKGVVTVTNIDDAIIPYQGNGCKGTDGNRRGRDIQICI